MTSRLIVDQLEGKPGSGNVVTVPTGHTLYSPGAVIQVVHQTNSTARTNSSHSITNGVWQFTGTTATITPKFATSKILIEYHQSFFFQTNTAAVSNANGHGTRIYRGNTAITNRNGFADFYLDVGDASNNRHHGYGHGKHLDSPNTTSAVTYNIYGYFWTADWTGLEYQYSGSESESTITLMEIGA